MAATLRVPGLDVARGLAVLSMYVAHFAPSSGPAGVLGLSEFLTAALFAFLIGVGVGVGRSGWKAVGLRAWVLAVLGLALERTDAQIAIVLVHLAIVLVGVQVVRGLPTALLAVLAAALALVTPVLGGTTALRTVSELWVAGGGALARPLAVFVVAGPYRLTELLALGVVGVLVAPRVRAASARHWWGVAAVAAVVALSLLVLGRLGAVDLHPYSGTLPVQLLDLALVLVVVGGALAATPYLPRWVVLSVAATGAMTLSAYVGQVLVAAAWVPGHPTDNSWPLLAALAVGTLGFATAWRLLLHGRARGPLEVVVDGLVRFGPVSGTAR